MKQLIRSIMKHLLLFSVLVLASCNPKPDVGDYIQSAYRLNDWGHFEKAKSELLGIPPNLLNAETKSRVANAMTRIDSIQNAALQDSIDRIRLDSIRVKDAFKQFKYPKSELFLGLYSGMTENEFNKRIEILIDKKFLMARGKFYQGDQIYRSGTILRNEKYRYLPGNGSACVMKAEFVGYPSPFTNSKSWKKTYDYYLVSIKLDISEIHNHYVKKYDVPKLKKWYIEENSKVGRYNNKYNPKTYYNLKISENGFQKSKRVNMPKELFDKSRNLDVHEKQVYYDNKLRSKLPVEEILIEIDTNSVLLYEKFWEYNSVDGFSLKQQSDDVALDLKKIMDLEWLENIESQSKQVITTTDYRRATRVTYTTKQYYDEKIRKPIIQKPKPKIIRDLKDEI